MLAAEWSLGSVLWVTVVFMFWVMAIWIFIALFSDILRRRDLSGGAKAGWILLLFVLPLLGSLIYIISRPNDLELGGVSGRT
jgi:ABC-type multidrug transport system permease subunit